jgi:hypothetical protein
MKPCYTFTPDKLMSLLNEQDIDKDGVYVIKDKIR